MKKSLLIVTIISSLIVSSGCSSGTVNNQRNTQSNITNTNDRTSSSQKKINTPSISLNNEITSSSTSNTRENIEEMQKKGLEIIENQSFWVELEKWGKVKFISSQFPDGGTFKLKFFLVDNQGNILYSFPEFYGSQFWFFYELRAISFKDVNNDGLKDIIVIADYTSGAGEEGAIPFPVASIYFQKGKGFITLPKLDQQINDAKKNDSIKSVVEFANGKAPKFN